MTNFTKDMNIIAALDDEPNDVGGLTAAQLKAKFDEGGLALKTFINGTLIPEAEALIPSGDAVIAEYGTTTYAAIKQAYDDGKSVFCKYNTNLLPLTDITASAATFAGSSTNKSITVVAVSSADAWSDTDATSSLVVTSDISNRAKFEQVEYDGDGTYGSNNPNSLTFSFAPKFVFIVNASFGGNVNLFLVNPATKGSYSYGGSSDRYVTWNDKTVSWYVVGYTPDANDQMNASGQHYIATAWG